MTSRETWGAGARRHAGTAFLFLVVLLIAVAVQIKGRAPQNSFTTYPDEPSHFIAAVMVRDYLAHPLASPLKFARDYYHHFPYFAIGYWPPMFYLMTGLWMLIAGVGRAQALFMGSVGAALTATALGVLLRRSAGWAAAIAGAIVYITLPEVQYWICAVMVDQWVCAFVLTAVAVLARYLNGEGSNRSLLTFSVLASFCVLTKYSGLFICALPVCCLLVPRWRRRLWQRGSLIFPITLAALVLPWAAWTSGLSFTGLPQERSGSFAARPFQFALEMVRTMPLVLAVVVICGIVAILFHRKGWPAELGVVALAIPCLIGFMAVSPVGFEHRYLMFGVACLLVLSFTGLRRILIPAGRAAEWVLPLFAISFAAIYFVRFPAPQGTPIRPMAEWVARDPGRSGEPILVPNDLEGATIAEFAAIDPRRPGYLLVRPSKLLSTQDWFGRKYSLRCRTIEDVAAALKAESVSTILIHDGNPLDRPPHEVLLREMLMRDSESWRLAASFDRWRIYETSRSR